MVIHVIHLLDIYRWKNYSGWNFTSQGKDVRDEIVDKPSDRDGGKRDTIAPEDEHVWDLSVLHGILLVTTGLVHTQPPDEYGKSRNNTESERPTPNYTKMVLTKAATRLTRRSNLSISKAGKSLTSREGPGERRQQWRSRNRSLCLECGILETQTDNGCDGSGTYW